MGVEDRDWFHEPQTGSPGRGSAVGVVLVALLVAAFIGWRFDVAPHYRSNVRPAAPVVESPPLYAPDDQWTAWLAPENVCPGGERADLAPAVEQATMLCLVNY